MRKKKTASAIAARHWRNWWTFYVLGNFEKPQAGASTNELEECGIEFLFTNAMETNAFNSLNGSTRRFHDF